jgi:chorismate-pyruvate lyase
LPRASPYTAQERLHGQIPEAAKLARQPLGRMVTASRGTVTVARHERQHSDLRWEDDLGDEPGRDRRETSQPAFLPARHERANELVVGERRTRGCER